MNKIICFICCLMLLVCLPAHVAAYTNESYETIFVTNDEKVRFLENCRFETLSAEEDKPAIEWFDISESGCIALGGHIWDDAVIYIYDIHGNYLYGYRFLNNHCALALSFEQENIAIYWNKSEYLGVFNKEGTCLQFEKVLRSASNIDIYHNNRYHPAKGTIGNIQYEAKPGVFSNYVQFAITDEYGNKQIIYDVETDYFVQMLMRTSIFIIVILVWATGYYYHRRKKDNNCP